MKCPLSKITGKDNNCDEQNCGIWDKSRTQCGLLSYINAYFTLLQATYKMTELTSKLHEEDEG